MSWNPGRPTLRAAMRAGLMAPLLAASVLSGVVTPAHASSFQLTSLVTDDQALLTGLGFPAAAHVDPNLINPWGVSFTPMSPFWVSDNGAGVATLYTAAGVQVSPPSPVTIFTPSGQTPGTASPTGQVFNSDPTAFFVSNGTTSGSANFIFASEDGTISGRSNAVDPSQSFLGVDRSAMGTGAVYKGLAIATIGGSQFLYAANFRAGTVEMYNSGFGFVKSFTDPSLPPVPPGTPPGQNWAPFNLRILNGQLFVSFALQASGGHDDQAGPGNGFVDVFNTDGTFVKRLINTGPGDPLNSPWGLDIAPAGFGAFANDLLVGNFGDGTIDAFDPNSGAFLGTLRDGNGNPFVIGDLWALVNGNNGAGSNPNAVFFTAGLMDEGHGLFGELAITPEPGSLVLLTIAMIGLLCIRRRRRDGAST
jgi:uncharacterized protein (TIGR03118 family)